MSPIDLTRRHALTTAAGVAAASLGPVGLLATPAAATPQAGPRPVPLKDDDLKAALRRLEARRRRILTGRPSVNGWDMEKEIDAGGSIWTREVPGTRGPLTLAARAGDVETVLVHVVRRFHYEIDQLGTKDEDPALQGWIHPGRVRDSGAPEANQASGTAVVIRPKWYVPGARGAFTVAQNATIRDILAECQGIVRWGGDDRRPYEGLFYLGIRPGDGRLATVAAKLRHWNETAGKGAGVLIDPSSPSRRRVTARYQ
ncbi:hypothetical protein [Streptomyces sp. NPDC001435]|uniref:hypothetical protein n=1 Tax=unclassified Streptomyces TaxID=2593676 RepID=UPI0036BDEF33